MRKTLWLGILITLGAIAALMLLRWSWEDAPVPENVEASSVIAAGTLSHARSQASEDAEAGASLERTEVEPSVPAAEGVLLTVTVIDPLGLLDHPHQVSLRRGSERLWQSDLATERNEFDHFGAWQRNGSVLTSLVRRWAPLPTHVTFALDLARPDFLDVAEAPITEIDQDHWQATLDLSECAAIVEFVVTDPARRALGYSLTVAFQGERYSGELGGNRRRPTSLTVVAPVPSTLITELNARDGSPQAAQRALFPILAAGRYRHELQLPAGSVRVKFHDPGDLDQQGSVSYTLELIPELEKGGQMAKSLISTSPGLESVFELVPPGRYQLWCLEYGGKYHVLYSRLIEVAEQEVFVEMFAPGDRRSLLLHQSAPAGTRYWLQRAGVSMGPRPEASAPGVTGEPVRFEGLDADEWIVWAMHDGLHATARADTRWSQESECTLGLWQTISSLEVELPTEFRKGSVVRVTHESGIIVEQPSREEDALLRFAVLPGLVQIRAFYFTGVVAEASVIVPPADSGSTLRVPLNFHAP